MADRLMYEAKRAGGNRICKGTLYCCASPTPTFEA
jgi:hypothetical protein